jgi:hypothetical protein
VAPGRLRLEQALRDHEIRRPLVTGSTSEGIRRWTRRLRPVFEATSETERCESINTLLADSARSVYLTPHDGLRPHLHFTPDGQDLHSRVKTVTTWPPRT